MDSEGEVTEWTVKERRQRVDSEGEVTESG